MIPKDHPRYRSLIARERLARCAREGVVALEGLAAHGRGEAFDYLIGEREGVVALEGLAAHGRGEAFDYLIGERTTPSAAVAARTAAAMLLSARHAVISVNGNTAALAADDIAALQRASGADVEVNLFHRTEDRVERITRLLESHGVRVLRGTAERLIPLSHDRALCLPGGIGDARTATAVRRSGVWERPS